MTYLNRGDIVRLRTKIPKSEYQTYQCLSFLSLCSPFHENQYCGGDKANNFRNALDRYQSQALRVEYHVTRNTVECSVLDSVGSESFSVFVAWLDLRSPLELLADAAE